MDTALKSLSIFDFPGYQEGIDNILYTKQRPVTTTQNDDIIEFDFSTSGEKYLYPKFSKLCVKCKIIKADGSSCSATDKYVPTNLLFQTMWKSVNVSLGSHIVTPTTGNFAYKSYIKTILKETGKTGGMKQSQFYAKDVEEFNQVGITKTEVAAGLVANGGMLLRMTWSKESKSFYMSGPLNDDFFEIDRLFPPNIDINVRLTRNNNAFCIRSGNNTDTFILKIEDIFFNVCEVKLNSALFLSHSKVLQNTNALYPFVRTEIKPKVVTKGLSQLVWDNIVVGVMPFRILVCFVKQSAYLGSRIANPFYFDHCKISNLLVCLNEESLTQRVYELDFETGNCLEPYLNLLDIFDKTQSPGDINLSLEEFVKGYTIFAYNVTEVIGHEQQQFPKPISGKLKLEATFSEPIEDTLNCLVFLQFQKLLKLDFARNIFID
jgi:hypothetical protein